MNVELIEKAHAKVQCIPMLGNMVSKRVAQLIAGERPLIKPLSADEDKADIALREIAEGKLTAQVDLEAIARAEQAQTRWSHHQAN